MKYIRESPSSNILYDIGKTTRRNLELNECGLINEKEIMQKVAYFYYMEEKSKYMYFINAKDYHIIKKFINLKNRISYLKIDDKEDIDALKNSELKNLIVLRIESFDKIDFKSLQEILQKNKIIGIEILNIGTNKDFLIDPCDFAKAKERYNKLTAIINIERYSDKKNIESIILEGHTYPYKFTEICAMPKELKEFLKAENIPICIELKDKEDIKRLKEKFRGKKFRKKIVLASEYVSNISPEDIEELKKSIKIDGILIGKRENENQEKMTVDIYNEIYSKLKKLTRGVGVNQEFYKKFHKIYKRIIKNIEYDEEKDNDLFSEKNQIYSYKNINKNRNLINGLFDNKTVCAGYSEILKQALSLVNIKSKSISGEVPDFDENDRYHAWNIVENPETKKWYNCDITWDLENIDDFKWELLSDKNFIDHIPKNKSERCDEDYDIGFINKIKNIPQSLRYRLKNIYWGFEDSAINVFKKLHNEQVFLDKNRVWSNNRELFVKNVTYRNPKITIMNSLATRRNNNSNIER